MPPEVAAAPPPALGRIRAHILRMTGLSTTAMKVLRTCNEPGVCANDLNRVIALDPILTGRVLQLVNSAYYGLPSKVSSLTRAIILLGLNTVKNLVLSFAVFEVFSRHDAFRVFSADRFWEHSLAAAVAARLLAERAGLPLAEREEHFVAGLMHDIGKIPLNQLFPDAYRQAIHEAAVDGGGIRAGEEKWIGADHCRVGLMIARKWELGEDLAGALAAHHPPGGRGGPGADGIARAVALADLIAHRLGASLPGGASVGEEALFELAARFPLAPAELEELSGRVAGEIEKARIFLEIAGRN